jgi:hypothetical protein
LNIFILFVYLFDYKQSLSNMNSFIMLVFTVSIYYFYSKKD